MNMTTNIDNIPLKTNKNDIDLNDDSNDPLVKDILNEFEKEVKANSKPQNDYVINYPPPPQTQNPQSCSIPFKKNNNNSYYNEDFIRKSAIIIIIIAFIFSPIIFNTIIEKLPSYLADIIDNYNYYVKLILSFLAIYLLFYYNLLS